MPHPWSHPGVHLGTEPGCTGLLKDRRRVKGKHLKIIQLVMFEFGNWCDFGVSQMHF